MIQSIYEYQPKCCAIQSCHFCFCLAHYHCSLHKLYDGTSTTGLWFQAYGLSIFQSSVFKTMYITNRLNGTNGLDSSKSFPTGNYYLFYPFPYCIPAISLEPSYSVATESQDVLPESSLPIPPHQA